MTMHPPIGVSTPTMLTGPDLAGGRPGGQLNCGSLHVDGRRTVKAKMQVYSQGGAEDFKVGV